MSYTLHITGSKADVTDLLQKLLSAVCVYNDEFSADLSIGVGGVQLPLEEILLSLRDRAEADTPHGVITLHLEAPR
jgi:hypothetical protein